MTTLTTLEMFAIGGFSSLIGFVIGAGTLYFIYSRSVSARGE